MDKTKMIGCTNYLEYIDDHIKNVNKCGKFLYDNNIIPSHGIKVNRKFIPTKIHFAKGKIYFGIYTLFINRKLSTTDVIALFEASLK